MIRANSENAAAMFIWVRHLLEITFSYIIDRLRGKEKRQICQTLRVYDVSRPRSVLYEQAEAVSAPRGAFSPHMEENTPERASLSGSDFLRSPPETILRRSVSYFRSVSYLKYFLPFQPHRPSSVIKK